MSLTLCITTPEGIVLAADSRQSYRNIVGAARIGSDSATKIFPVNERIGITVAGPAFLVDPNDTNVNPKGIGSYIQDFLNQTSKEETVKTITEKLQKYLKDIYKPDEQFTKMEAELEKQLTQIGGKIIKKEKGEFSQGVIIDFTDKDGKPQKAIAEIMPISVIVAGYDLVKVGKPEINAYNLLVPGPMVHIREHGDQNQYGANWTGQTDVVTRVVLGFDPRAENLSFIQGAKQNIGEQKISDELKSLEYNINWGAMTLYDAVDFAKLMIQTTSAVQRFSDGIKMLPGEMPGVGGSIDVAIILPYEGFQWHQKKALQLDKVSLP